MSTSIKVSAKSNNAKTSTAKATVEKKAATKKATVAKKTETKPPVPKAEQVRRLLTKNPELTNQQIVNIFKEKDIKIYWSQVDGARKVLEKELETKAK